MNIIRPALLALLISGLGLSLPACNKRDEIPANTGGSALAPQTWTVDSTAYIANTVARSGNMLYASGPIGLISFHFASLPTSGGIYTVGDNRLSPANVAIESRTGDDYLGQSGIVVVSITNGKISIDAANIRMVNMPMVADTVVLAARLTEQ
jgi:hypothetical protein